MDDLAVPIIVKLGGGATMVTGAFTLGLAAQTAMLFRMQGLVVGVVAAMVVLGIAAVVTGWGTSRGRRAPAIGAAATAGLIAALGTVWAITGLMSGVISPLSFGVVVFATVAAIVAGLAIGPTRKITMARDALRAQGLDFGM